MLLSWLGGGTRLFSWSIPYGTYYILYKINMEPRKPYPIEQVEKECPKARECFNAKWCTLSDVHQFCSVFRELTEKTVTPKTCD